MSTLNWSFSTSALFLIFKVKIPCLKEPKFSIENCPFKVEGLKSLAIIVPDTCSIWYCKKIFTPLVFQYQSHQRGENTIKKNFNRIFYNLQ